MELIRNLGTRISKTGRFQSWAEFFCTLCKTYVVKRLGDGKKAKSCGCIIQSEEYKQKMSNIKKGTKLTKKARQKISEKAKERYKNPKNNPMYGKQQTEEAKQKVREANMGHLVTEQTKQKIREKRKLQIMIFGESHWNWQDGKSFEPYSFEFNKEKKRQVLERDNYACQDPNCDGNHTKLHVHHIDYDKKNNNLENLITLCSSCHSKTNGKKLRNYFTEFYNNLTNERVI